MSKGAKREHQQHKRREEREARIKAAKRRQRTRLFTVGGVIVALIVGVVVLTRDSGSTDSLAGGPGCDGIATGSKTYTEAPSMKIDPAKTYHAKMTTSMGVIDIDLFAANAPKTVNNFVTLACDGFYDGIVFHRVITDFMIQGGDPDGKGTGGPGYQFEDEFDATLNFAEPGILAMANSGPNTNGSQFFITVAPTPHLNQKHTIFGKVTAGYETAVAISTAAKGANDQPTTPITIDGIEITES